MQYGLHLLFALKLHASKHNLRREVTLLHASRLNGKAAAYHRQHHLARRSVQSGLSLREPDELAQLV